MSNISHSRSLNILLADDEDDLRLSLAELLNFRGHRVIDAANGQHALELFHANQNELDLIISDICMPGLSGIELGKRIREKNKNIPIAFITGFGQEEEIRAAKVIGNRVFKKPIDYSALESFIATL